jgi:hypothetical protein
MSDEHNGSEKLDRIERIPWREERSLDHKHFVYFTASELPDLAPHLIVRPEDDTASVQLENLILYI